MKNGITNIIFPFVTCLLLFACTQEQKTSAKVDAEKPSADAISENPKPNPSNATLTLLLFKAERKLEIWTSSPTPQRLADLKITQLQPFPVGQYLLQATSNGNFSLKQSPLRQAQQKLLLNPYPQYQDVVLGTKEATNIRLSAQSYQQFTKQLPPSTECQVFVFPNDIRTEGEFLACYPCPHWMAEVYAQLEMELRAFSL